MKAATGELNLTVITVIAIAAIMAFFGTILWPKIQGTINNQWEKTNDDIDVGYINIAK